MRSQETFPEGMCMFKMTTISLHLTHKLKLSMLVDVSSYFDDFQENSSLVKSSLLSEELFE